LSCRARVGTWFVAAFHRETGQTPAAYFRDQTSVGLAQL